MSEPNPMPDEDRFDLTSRADRQERASRPKGLIVLGVVALVIMGGWCLLSLRSLWSAQKEAGRERAWLAQAQELAGELDAIRTLRGQNRSIDAHEPDRQMVPKITQMAVAAGLPEPKWREKQTPFASGPQGYERKLYAFDRLSFERVDPLLRWVETAVSSIPGLEVDSFRLEPTADKWALTVEFGRWERKS
ncbi:MAG: hypothetical protein H6811_03160 [Phycisphaeraceae bacterium]|nr:hypothetical protein [Phycisphaeraceae bacterium]